MKKKFISGKNWFFEDIKINNSPTFTWGFCPEKELYAGKSDFQKVNVFETKEFGRILILDGLIQFSTKSEFIYHEMLAHPAFFCCENPGKVLIIGGGDGGALREVVKYKNVKEIFLVDIDKKVIEISKKYFPKVSDGAFSDRRLKILHEDALKFVRRHKNYFDIIIDDLTDPCGPSQALWTRDFYKDIGIALKENGVASFQTAYLQEGFAKKSRKDIESIFPFFKMHKAHIRCFPLDEHTFSLGSKKIDFDKVTYKNISGKFKKLNIKTSYYSPEIHFSSAVLPACFR